MKKCKPEWIAKCLLILWIISMVIVGICARIYITIVEVNGGPSPLDLFSGYQFFVMGLTVFYSMPFLYFIQHYSKLAKMTAIKVFARLVICHHIIWLILGIAEMLMSVK